MLKQVKVSKGIYREFVAGSKKKVGLSMWNVKMSKICENNENACENKPGNAEFLLNLD